MELTKYDEFQGIENIVDLPELLKKIKQIDALKIALESCERFRENAIRYARLEAAALIRVGELGGIGHLKGFRQKVAAWLFGLSEAERENYIEMCAEGMTIDQIWKRDIYTEEKLTNKINDLYELREYLVDVVKEEGIISTQNFVEEARKTLPDKMAEDAIDGLRGALRQAGAVGIGDNSGMYVMPTKERSDKVRDAVIMRFESAVADFEKLRNIAKGAKIKMSYKDFVPDIYITDRNGQGYMLHFLIALERMGIIEDTDEMWLELKKSNCYADIDFVKEISGKKSVEAAQIVLDNYKKQQEKENIA